MAGGRTILMLAGWLAGWLAGGMAGWLAGWGRREAFSYTWIGGNHDE
jgi:hypothetical protein